MGRKKGLNPHVHFGEHAFGFARRPRLVPHHLRDVRRARRAALHSHDRARLAWLTRLHPPVPPATPRPPLPLPPSKRSYERALRWLFSTAAWRLCPERHVFTHMLTHALREALRTDLRRQAHGLGQARGSRALAASATPPARPSGTYARMGAGILVSAEDRRYDWLEARACGHVVPAPYYSPPFFLRGTAPFAPSAAGLPAPGARRALIVESGPRSTACHRFDNRATPNRWACHGAELRYSRFVRMAAKSAMLDVARAAGERVEAHATQRTDKGYAELDGLLRAKAAMYAASTFCLVLAGDSVITTRIFSVVQSLCVPGTPRAVCARYAARCVCPVSRALCVPGTPRAVACAGLRALADPPPRLARRRPFGGRARTQCSCLTATSSLSAS